MTKHSSGPEDGRPLPLGKRIGQIAERLAGNEAVDAAAGSDLATRTVHARRLRHQYFPGILFGEPAWEMLLELLRAQSDGRSVTVTNLCEAAGTPGVVTFRWLNVLVAEGLVRRVADPRDPTTELVELEPKASQALRHYFDELSSGQ